MTAVLVGLSARVKSEGVTTGQPKKKDEGGGNTVSVSRRGR